MALRMVDSWTRRRIVVSAACSTVLALLESLAFALLYTYMNAISHAGSVRTGRTAWFSNTVGGVTGTTRLGLLVVFVMVVKSCLAAGLAWWQAGVQSQSEARLTSKVFAGYLRQPYVQHLDEHSAVRMRNLLLGAGVVSTQLIGAAISVFTDLAVLTAILVTLLSVEPVASAALLLYLLALMGFYTLTLAPTIQRLAHRDNQNGQAVAYLASEALTGIKMVQVFNVAETVRDVFQASQRSMAASRQRLIGLQRFGQYYFEIALVLGLTVAAVVLTRRDSPAATFTVLAVLVAAALRVLPSVNRILGSFNSIRGSHSYIQPLQRALVAMPPDAGAVSTTKVKIELSDRLTLDRVSFRYRGAAQDAVNEMTLEIRAGQSLGIVGLSGAGKTTLVDVILGLLTPSTGFVSVDGVRLTSNLMADWRAIIGYVPQEAFLIDGTIYDNIVFHRKVPDARARVAEAVRVAQLADFISQLPNGLDTHIGERGAKLSGGQRQRVAIARAVLTNPRLLVFDEATSSLDGVTEQALTETMARLRGRLTMVIVAHRLSTVRQCDRIAFLDKGRLADIGTFSQLGSHNSSFAALVKAGVLSADRDSSS